MKKKIVIPENVYNCIQKTISFYSIGLVKVKTDEKGSIVSMLMGSGTLVKIGEIYGIITAQHVSKEFDHMKDDLGLVMPGTILSYFLISQKTYHIIDIAKATNRINDADLSFIVLPNSKLGTIKAKMSFYDLEQFRDLVLKTDLSIDTQDWVISGYIDAFTENEGAGVAFQNIKKYSSTAIFTKITNCYTNKEFDFIEVGAHAGEGKGVPSSYGGLSGGGLWQFVLDDKDKQITLKDVILSGVVFYQSGIKDGNRYITCNGRQSIYKIAYEIIKNN